MALKVFPTNGDVGGGGRVTESLLAGLASALSGSGGVNFIHSGLTIQSTAGLNVTVAPGVAVIDGYLVEIDAAEVVAVNASESGQAWHLQLTINGEGLVTGHQWVRVIPATVLNADGSESPARSVSVFEVDTGASSISASAERRPMFGTVCGHYVGDGNTTSHAISLGGRTPTKVEVMGDGQSGSTIYGVSTINRFPGGSNPGFYIDAGGSGWTTLKWKRPALEPYGFSVRHDAAFGTGNDSLNVNGVRYTYLAHYAGSFTS